MGVQIRECKAKDFTQFGVSVTLEKCWDFVLALSRHVYHYVERVDVEGRCCVYGDRGVKYFRDQ